MKTAALKRAQTVFVIMAMLLAFPVVSYAAGQDSLDLNGFRRYWNSLIFGNTDRTFEKKMDLSFAVAPSYTREGSIGIGGAATALYRIDRTDSIMQPSDISLAGSASIKGLYALSMRGNNNFKGNKSSLSYKLAYFRKNLNLWGISYDGCTHNPLSAYTRQQFRLDLDYRYKLLSDFYIGGSVNLNYTQAVSMTAPQYLEGQKPAYFLGGLGLSLQYDSRDLIVNPSRGIYFLVKEVLYPSFSGTYGKNIYSTTIIFDAYLPVWAGGIVAFDLYGQLNGSYVPWVMREELGSGGSRMRGYYAGRYIDNNQVSAQIEVRQHIYGRLGCTAWVGAGSVFNSIRRFDAGDILPNYGVGLRFEFKHRMNIRLDYGFGKGTSGLVVQFAEAF